MCVCVLCDNFFLCVTETKQNPKHTPKTPKIWFGAAVATVPFIIGAYEFGKRILIQRRCMVCAGSGLVSSARAGTKYLRKCPQCGGFFPWVSWRLFLTGTADVGNGGPLLQPRGQTSVLYKVPPLPPASDVGAAQEAAAQEVQQQAVDSTARSDDDSGGR